MRRKFQPFDQRVINDEFRRLSAQDATSLKVSMKQYQQDSGVGYTLKSYEDGLWMLTDSGRGQGRCIFFRSETVRNEQTGEFEERLTVLLIYKKETQKVPQSILATAKQRMERS